MTYFQGLPQTEQRVVTVALAIESLTVGHGGGHSLNPSMRDIARRSDEIHEYILTGVTP